MACRRNRLCGKVKLVSPSHTYFSDTQNQISPHCTSENGSLMEFMAVVNPNKKEYFCALNCT